jgi:beta propeller repeat protein
MKRTPIRGLLAAALLATTLWSGTPAFAYYVGEEVRIDSSNPVISKAGFDISKDYAVWIAEGEKVITLYDLDEHKESQIGDKQSAKTNLRVDGKYVAWIDSRHGGSDVYLYDIGTKKERRLTDGTTEAAELELSGNYVAWSGKHGGKSDIYLYNINTGEEVRVSTSGEAGKPTVSTSYVAWEDRRNGNVDIYYYDIKSGRERAAVTALGHQTNPSIYDDQIVYQDERYDDLYVYVIGRDRNKRLTEDSNKQAYPHLYEDTYVFVEDGALLIGDIDYDDAEELDEEVYDKLPPRIYGDYVIFAKQDGDKNVHLYLYDLDDEELVPIGGLSGDPSQPDGDDRYVVYINENKKTSNVILHDLHTQTSSVISKSGSEPRRPLVSNRYVVWYDGEDEALIAYDIRRGTQKRVTSTKAVPSDTLYELDGSKLAWIDDDRDLYVTDLSTEKTEDIARVRDPKAVDIYDNFVMWVTERSGKDTIYLYDLDEEDETEVRADADITGASLGDNVVVWSEYSSKTKTYDLYYYDIDRDRTDVLLRWTDGDQIEPQASRDLVLFKENRGSRNKEQFTYELYDIEDESFSKYYWSDDAEMDEVRLSGNRVVWIDTRDGNPAVYTIAVTDPRDDDDDDNGGEQPGDYREYNFAKVLEDDSLLDIIGDNDFEDVYFVFFAGTKNEVSLNFVDALNDSDRFLDLLYQSDLDDIVIRVYN